MRRDIVVIGASAGGLHPLEQLVAGLPATLDAAVLVALHVPADGFSVLPAILTRAGHLKATHAIDGEALEPGRIYVAPPNAHLMLEPGRIRLGHGPPENGHRPAIDVLFRSAAHAYRARVVGVILSGSLDDGTAGLWAIKRRGGLAIVQDPAEAQHTGMIHSALDGVQVDRVMLAAALGPFLAALVREQGVGDTDDDDEQIGQEVALAISPIQGRPLEQPYGPGASPAALSCPSCRGTLWEIREGELARYRCQVGHAYSPWSLLAAQDKELEDALWAACRALEENAALAQRLAQRAGASNRPKAQSSFEGKAKSATERASTLRQALLAAAAEPHPTQIEDTPAETDGGAGGTP